MSASIENPYPGLRPFDNEFSPYFFGRDKHVAELVNRLQSNRFVAVVKRGVADSLVDKLEAAAKADAKGHACTKAEKLSAYARDVAAQSGKSLTAAQAAVLTRLAAALKGNSGLKCEGDEGRRE